MRLFLIRHGETIDNVAQVYAGVRDSALTNHGALQAERLGKFFAKADVHFTHIFSSDLQRATKTAQSILSWNEAAQPGTKVNLTTLALLQEQDFGFYEGKPFYARPRDSNKSGKEDHRSHHQDDPDFRDVEPKDSMASRMVKFLSEYLVPIIQKETKRKTYTVAVVSHGIILSHLWRCFLELLPKNSVTLAPGLSVGSGKVTPLEYLGGWSNTGYLELRIHEKEADSIDNTRSAKSAASSEPIATNSGKPSPLSGHQVIIQTVNGKEHLQGLKRTKGGVGSSKFDEGQKSIDSFFKKRRT